MLPLLASFGVVLIVVLPCCGWLLCGRADGVLPNFTHLSQFLSHRILTVSYILTTAFRGISQTCHGLCGISPTFHGILPKCYGIIPTAHCCIPPNSHDIPLTSHRLPTLSHRMLLLCCRCCCFSSAGADHRLLLYPLLFAALLLSFPASRVETILLLIGNRARSNPRTLYTSTLFFKAKSGRAQGKIPLQLTYSNYMPFKSPPLPSHVFLFVILFASCRCVSLAVPAPSHRRSSHLFDVSVVRFVQTCSRETPKRSSRYTW